MNIAKAVGLTIPPTPRSVGTIRDSTRTMCLN